MSTNFNSRVADGSIKQAGTSESSFRGFLSLFHKAPDTGHGTVWVQPHILTKHDFHRAHNSPGQEALLMWESPLCAMITINE